METEDRSGGKKARVGLGKSAGATLGALFFGPLLLAGCATSPDLKSAEHLVQGNFHGKAHVVKVFPGPTQKLTGIIAENSQHQQGILWMLSNRYLLLGPVVNDKGQDITQAARKSICPNPERSPPDRSPRRP